MTDRAPTLDLLVVTDLDGTLLDEATYAYAPAGEALDALRRRGALLVVATSKTYEEVVALALPMEAAAIVENGGAVFVPTRCFAQPPEGARREGDAFVFELGLRHDLLVRHLEAIACETRVRLSGFASLAVEEVAGQTGLPLPVATLARQRRYDEPFLVEDEAAVPRVMEAARRRGLQVTRGGRFLHLVGAATDKGRALVLLLRAYAAEGRHFTTVGLGDAANDLTLLRAVDRPIIVPRPGGAADPVLAAALPGAEQAPRPGPEGWNAAVLTLLAGHDLPRLAGGRR